jgi:hypothetical protein
MTPSATRRDRPAAAVVIGCWIAFAAVYYAIWRLQHLGLAAPIVRGATAGIAARAVFWCLATFGVFRFNRYLDARPVSLASKIALHFVAALLFTVVDIGLSRAVVPTFGQLQGDLQFPQFYASLLDGSLFLYCAIVSADYAYEWHRMETRGRLRLVQLRTALATSQMHALTLQMQPHFLFNTLNTVSEVVHRDRAKAARMIRNIRTLLAESMHIAPAGLVSLADEIDFLLNYVELQRVRFPGMHFELDIEQRAREAGVPHFLLQPIVENAIRHGLAPRNGAGVIRVEGHVVDQAVVIVVSDNGVGPNRNASHGMGLRNVQERLAQMFGRNASITLSAAPAGGATVRMEMPLVEAPSRMNSDAGAVIDDSLRSRSGGDVPSGAATPRRHYSLRGVVFAGVSFVAALTLLKDAEAFDLRSSTRDDMLLWAKTEAFTLISWIILGTIAVLIARRVVKGPRRARWIGVHTCAMIALPVASLVVRYASRATYDPAHFHLISPRAFYWMGHDAGFFAVISSIAYMVTLYQRWLETEIDAATVFGELQRARLDLLRTSLNPGELLLILDRLADVAIEDPNSADFLTGRLGELLRVMLEQGEGRPLLLEIQGSLGVGGMLETA